MFGGDPVSDTFYFWCLLWVVSIIGVYWFWDYLIHTVPVVQDPINRSLMIGAYGVLALVTLTLFVFVLRAGPYQEFGFYGAVFGPCITFWGAMALFAFGITKTAIAVGTAGQKKHRLTTTVSALWKYTGAQILMHAGFAAAYSSSAGLVLSALVIVQSWCQRHALPERRDRRQRQRDKWE
jgi:hypothetical protein